MEIAKREFNLKIGEKLNIYFLGDIHEGNCNHADAELKEAVRIIQNDPVGYWIGMGDYIEAINSKDPRFNPVEIAEYYRLKDLKDLPKTNRRKMPCPIDRQPRRVLHATFGF